MADHQLLTFARTHRDDQRNKTVWAPAAVNGSAAVALSGVIGAADNAQQMLQTFLVPYLLFIAGIITGAFAVYQHRRDLEFLARQFKLSADVREAVDRSLSADRARLDFAPHRPSLIIALGSEEKADDLIKNMWRGLEKEIELATSHRTKMSDRLDREGDIPALRRRAVWARRLGGISFVVFAFGTISVAFRQWLS